jgi:hypothetical protein
VKDEIRTQHKVKWKRNINKDGTFRISFAVNLEAEIQTKTKKDSSIRCHTTCHLLLTGKQNKNDNFNSDKTQIRLFLIITYYSVVQQSAIVQAVESVKDRSWWKCFLKSNLLLLVAIVVECKSKQNKIALRCRVTALVKKIV